MMLISGYFNNLFFFVFAFLQEEKNCGAPCRAMFFKETERTQLRYWVGSLAALCCASCLFTVSTVVEFALLFCVDD